MYLIYLLLGATTQILLTKENTGILGRSAGTEAFCAYSDYRPANVSSLVESYRTYIKSQIPNNQLLKLIDGAFKGNLVSLSSLTGSLDKTATGGAMLIAPILVPLLILLVVFPFLFCCCLCSYCCPSKCCRQKSSMQQTKCSRYWPLVLFAITGLCMVASGLGSLILSKPTSNSIAYIQCQAFSTFQTITNGRLSNDNQSYFVGVTPAVTKLKSLKDNINQIKTRSTSITTFADNVNSAYTTFTTNIANRYNQFTNPVYSNAFYQSDGTTVFTVNSILKQTFLGPQTKSATVYNILLTFMKGVHDAITPAITSIKSGISFLNSNTNTIQSFIDTGISSINSIGSVLPGDLASQAGGKQVPDGVYSSLIGISLFIFFYALIAIVAGFLMMCCNINCCKHALKCLCLIGYFMFFIVFILALILSVLSPVSSIICQNYNQGLINDRTKFSKLFESFLPGGGGKAIELLSTCITGGDITSSIGGDFSSTIDKIGGLTGNSQSFSQQLKNAGFTDSAFQLAKGSTLQILVKLQNNQIYDISQEAIDHLNRVANLNYPTGACNAQINSDSWIPTSKNSLGACKSGIAPKTGNCSSLAVAGCSSGCFSFTMNLGTSTNPCSNPAFNCTPTTPANNVQTQVQSRYGTVANCPYSKYIVNLNSNWDSVRQSSINTFKVNMEGANGGYTAMTNYKTSIDSLVNSLSSLNTLIAGLSVILGKDTGIFGGLNCKPFNQQLNLFFRSYCYGFSSQLTSLMIFWTITAYSLVLSMICMICLTNRFEYHKALAEEQDLNQQIQSAEHSEMNLAHDFVTK